MRFTLLLAAAIAAAALAGCVSDDDPPTDTSNNDSTAAWVDDGSHPAFGFETRDAVGASVAGAAVHGRDLPVDPALLEHVLQVPGVDAGAGIYVFGQYAYVGQYGGTQKLWAVDISDPTAPFVAGAIAGVPVRDADFIAFPDGRNVLVTASGSGSIVVTDVTDPDAMEIISSFEAKNRQHNVAVVPGTPIVYNSPSADAPVDIWDLSNPLEPVFVQDFEGAGCHDVTFYLSQAENKYRAYCAGNDVIEIWDIADPAYPTIVSSTLWPALGLEGAGSISSVTWAHMAMPNGDASILIAGDETGGGSIPPGCDVHAQVPGAVSASGPLGNLFFFDLSDETAPSLQGSISPSLLDRADLVAGSCTAHFGGIVDANHLVMAFYNAGVWLVDFTDLASPFFEDQFTADGIRVWDAQVYKGYVFTGDLGRGMDILTFS